MKHAAPVNFPSVVKETIAKALGVSDSTLPQAAPVKPSCCKCRASSPVSTVQPALLLRVDGWAAPVVMSPAAERECSKWIIEALGHCSQDGVTQQCPLVSWTAPGCQGPPPSSGLASQEASVTCSAGTFLPTHFPHPVCILCPLCGPPHSAGSVQRCLRHTKSKQGWRDAGGKAAGNWAG